MACAASGEVGELLDRAVLIYRLGAVQAFKGSQYQLQGQDAALAQVGMKYCIRRTNLCAFLDDATGQKLNSTTAKGACCAAVTQASQIVRFFNKTHLSICRPAAGGCWPPHAGATIRGGAGPSQPPAGGAAGVPG
jgi:hypothetical protein